MRIAHIITRLIIGGAQENTLLSCEDLQRIHGDDVLLITGPPLGPEGSLIERAEAHGVPLDMVPEMRRAIHPWLDFVAYRKIKASLRRFRPDVVHTHSAKAGILGRMAATALKTPVVIHGVHGAPFHPYQGWAGRFFCQACERWAASKCHAFISVADAMTDLMVEAGVAPRDRFTTIYSGMEVDPLLQADEHRERVRKQLGYGPDDVVVGKIARLFHLKGHDDVITAAARVIERCPTTRFLFVGDGILAEPLRQRIESLGLTSHFQFTGLVPPSQIPELIGAMDVVVHASLREGLARVLPQGLLAGKPCVSYDIDGAREVVVSGETGFLIRPLDVAGLADALAVLATDPVLRDRLGQEGRRRCEEVFRHEYMTQRIRELYCRLLAERTAAR